MRNLFALLALWLTTIAATVAQTNNALHFDGSDDYVQLAELPTTSSFANGFTFTAWVKWDAFQGNARLCDLASGTGANENIIVRIADGTSKLVLQSMGGTMYNTEIVSNEGVVATGEWVHVAATLDASRNAVIYVNGVDVKTGYLNIPANVARAYSYLGKSAWDTDKYFSGSMDEVSIWNRSLTQAEVVNIHTQRMWL